MHGLWGMGQMIPRLRDQIPIVVDDDVDIHNTSEVRFRQRSNAFAVASVHSAPPGRSASIFRCPSLLVGGVEDHVHLLARFGRTITQAEWVKELKRVSNLWLKERGRDYADFEWQGGYADFSVSQSNLEQVKQYIAGQEEHHRKIGFQDELRALLRKHEIEWDEKYVWD